MVVAPRANGAGDGRPRPGRRRSGRASARKRVLVVNAFMDEYRRTRGSPFRAPRAMGAVYLAGVFSNALCDVRVYSEQYSGVLKDTRLIAWPDMLVMTGVTTSFDRMLHLTAYARTLNPKVVVVAGGPPVAGRWVGRWRAGGGPVGGPVAGRWVGGFDLTGSLSQPTL